MEVKKEASDLALLAGDLTYEILSFAGNAWLLAISVEVIGNGKTKWSKIIRTIGMTSVLSVAYTKTASCVTERLENGYFRVRRKKTTNLKGKPTHPIGFSIE